MPHPISITSKGLQCQKEFSLTAPLSEKKEALFSVLEEKELVILLILQRS